MTDKHQLYRTLPKYASQEITSKIISWLWRIKYNSKCSGKSESGFYGDCQGGNKSRRFSCLKKSLIVTFSILLILLTLAFVVFPVTVLGSVSLQTFLVFTNFDLPRNPEYNNFEKYNVEGVRNIYVTVKDESNSSLISLGVWHVLPEYYIEASKTNSDIFDEVLNSTDFDVVIYLHGNIGTRIFPLALYQVLQRSFHVIAVDYRSYGDSTEAELTEKGVVNDLKQFYKWVRARTPANIYIWGHSLGAALGTFTAAVLIDEGVEPTGLILEAPFTTLREEIPLYPFAKIFTWLPWFTSTVTDPLENNGFRFKTTTHILKVNCPIMILHAEDDGIVPYQLGRKLAEIARTRRNHTIQGNVTYHQFAAHHAYNHLHINRAPELLTYVEEFRRVCEEFKWENDNKHILF